MRSRIKEAFVDFATNTSIHGVKYTVIASTILERIFWLLIFISSLSFAGYLTTLFWARYTSNPTRTTLKTAFAPIVTVPFPAVTICNRNKALDSKVNTFLTKLDANAQELLIIKNLFPHLYQTDLMGKNELVYNITELDIAQNVLDQNDYSDMRRVVRQVSQRCENLIIRCSWNKQEVLCKDIFEESLTTDGRCCSFNYIREQSLKSVLYSPYYGLSTGLRVLLRPEDNNLAGVTVIVHNPETVPSAQQNLRNYLPVGRVNYMQIDGSKRECSQQLKILPVSHRQCLYFEEKELNYFSKYTDSNCMSICKAMSIYRICGCVPYYFDFVDDKPICNARNLPCLQDTQNEVTAVEACGCLSQCEDEFYDITVTSGKFIYNPQVWMMDFLDRINSTTENTILLNIFFSTNRQTIWIRDTMTSGIYLISSFGGIYSLFLGCSIITLIEILYYCIGKCIVKRIFRENIKQAKHFQKVNFKCENVYTVSKGMTEQDKCNSHPIMPFIN